MDDSNSSTAVAAWRANATELAAWTWSRLVNRTDVWGGYLPLSRRTKTEKIVTKPPPAKRGGVTLKPAILRRHFAGAAVSDVVGLHTTSADNTCRWFLIEIDRHDGDRTADPVRNW